jgi:formylglycine-generating enzyme required for sulfatase activity
MSTVLDADPLLRDVRSVAGWKYLSPAVLYSKVGQGGMGSVDRGRHLELDIDVAVKCLNPVLAASDPQFEGPCALRDWNAPVERVRGDEAQEYCRQHGCALPSESQWEYACRAGTTMPYSPAATLRAEAANYDASRTYGAGRRADASKGTVPVRSYPPNAWGLHEMHGNVREWCLDGYRREYQTLPQKDPQEPGGSLRLLRGGGWQSGPAWCRSARRDRVPAEYAEKDLGFRVARALP